METIRTLILEAEIDPPQNHNVLNRDTHRARKGSASPVSDVFLTVIS